MSHIAAHDREQCDAVHVLFVLRPSIGRLRRRDRAAISLSPRGLPRQPMRAVSSYIHPLTRCRASRTVGKRNSKNLLLLEL